MKKLLVIAALALGAWAVSGTDARADGFGVTVSGGFGGYPSYYRPGHVHCHPGTVVRHYDYYHYVPGQYDYYPGRVVVPRRDVFYVQPYPYSGGVYRGYHGY
jgi:hypothetical protein